MTSTMIEYCYDSLAEEQVWIWIKGKSAQWDSDSVWLGWNGSQIDVGSRECNFIQKNSIDPWTSEGSDGLRIQTLP